MLWKKRATLRKPQENMEISSAQPHSAGEVAKERFWCDWDEEMEHCKNHEKSESSLPAREVMHSGIAYRVSTESTERDLQKQEDLCWLFSLLPLF